MYLSIKYPIRICPYFSQSRVCSFPPNANCMYSKIHTYINTKKHTYIYTTYLHIHILIHIHTYKYKIYYAKVFLLTLNCSCTIVINYYMHYSSSI